MKDLGKMKFFLELQIEHFPTRGLVHQLIYIKKTLEHCNMDKTHSLSSLMVVQPLDVKNNSFRQCKKGKNLLGYEVPYFNVINALMYLNNCIVHILFFC